MGKSITPDAHAAGEPDDDPANTGGEDLADAIDAPAEDPRDAEIAALRAELERRRNPDPRDVELARLRAELAAEDEQPLITQHEPGKALAMAAIKADRDAVVAETGEMAELRKAMASLQEQLANMQKSGGASTPINPSDEPDPYLYGITLACGDVDVAQHPQGTHHFCSTHGTVPVKGVYLLSDEMRAAANA